VKEQPVTIASLLRRNQRFARTFTPVPMGPPAENVLVVTCLDHRVDPSTFLGLDLGDAPVIRNAGGRVTPEVIDDIAVFAFVAERMFAGRDTDETLFEVAVIHHTQCGSGLLADDDFRHGYAQLIGGDEVELADHAVSDPTASVATDVERLRSARPISPRVAVSGHVYDVVTGEVTTVVRAGSADPASGAP
jgi:carbonic anhydrase